jgi:hypothetical protein
LPNWLSFDPATRTFKGTPTVYGTYQVKILARDDWFANATLAFEIIAGVRPNTAPRVIGIL